MASALERAVRGDTASLAREYASDVRIFNSDPKKAECFLRMVAATGACPVQSCVARLKDR